MAAITFFTASFLFSFFSLLSSAFSSKISPGRRQKAQIKPLRRRKGSCFRGNSRVNFCFLGLYSHKTGPAAFGSCQTLCRTWFTEKQSCNTQGTDMTPPCRGKCHKQEPCCVWQLSHLQDTKSHPWSICFSEATIT